MDKEMAFTPKRTLVLNLEYLLSPHGIDPWRIDVAAQPNTDHAISFCA